MRGFGFCCVHCQQPLAIAHHGLCSRCNQQIRRFAYCGHCGKELTRDALRCGHCLQHKASWGSHGDRWSLCRSLILFNSPF